MNSNLQVWLGDPSIMDQQVKWEWVKFKVRESAMKFAKEKSRLKKDRIADLTNKLDQLEVSLAHEHNENILEEIQVIKDELEEIDAKLIEGIVIHSRLRWSEKGEGK